MIQEQVSLSDYFNRTILVSESDNIASLTRENLQLRTPT